MKIKWRKGAFYDVRRLPKVVATLERSAERIAEHANGMGGTGDGGYMTGSQQGRRAPQGRWRASVVTATGPTIVDNARNNTLVKSMDAGKL
ncbi:MAG: hypothetical protein K0U84_18365 [Actinomycetia bacterium]|nr:hypothetical protein [Actinomycetes bacterium]